MDTFQVTTKYFVLFLLVLLSIVACGSSDKDGDISIKLLKNSFEDLYLAEYGKEYPYTKQRLQKCLKENHKKCLQSYNYVLKAKEEITSLPKELSLKLTFRIIEDACRKSKPKHNIFICHGGIMSLYFYSSDKQDAFILKSVNQLSKKTRDLIFNHEFSWYYNRSNPDQWINYLSDEKIHWKDEDQKAFIISLFKKNISTISSPTGLLILPTKIDTQTDHH